MRLWHESLISYLPRQQLLGQHRECCALRGKGWGKKHATVNYVFDHPYEWLVAYHYIVIAEMESRGYKVDPQWKKLNYRGKDLGFVDSALVDCNKVGLKLIFSRLGKINVYLEHDDKYLLECLGNLEAKGIEIKMQCKPEACKAGFKMLHK